MSHPDHVSPIMVGKFCNTVAVFDTYVRDGNDILDVVAYMLGIVLFIANESATIMGAT